MKISTIYYFNTSHVTFYLDVALGCGRGNYISIHLMLLFILTDPSIVVAASLFQYISCYCLSRWLQCTSCTFSISIHLMLLFIQVRGQMNFNDVIFQYISCYCLSLRCYHSELLQHPFQYISCYCLSIVVFN